MSAERSALPDPVVSRVELDGLDDLFEAAQKKDLLTLGLSVSEAVYYFGKSKKEIRRLLRSGDLPAIRVGDQDEKKWRIFPEGVPGELSHLIPIPETAQEAVAQEAVPESNTEECAIVPVPVSEQSATMQTRLDQALAKIEYLEAKITGLEDEVRYLAQAHHKPAGWRAAAFVIPVVAIVLAILTRVQF